MGFCIYILAAAKGRVSPLGFVQLRRDVVAEGSVSRGAESRDGPRAACRLFLESHIHRWRDSATSPTPRDEQGRQDCAVFASHRKGTGGVQPLHPLLLMREVSSLSHSLSVDFSYQ